MDHKILSALLVAAMVTACSTADSTAPTPTLFVIPTLTSTPLSTVNATRSEPSTPTQEAPTQTMAPTMANPATETQSALLLMQADYLHKREEIIAWARDIKDDYDPTFGRYIEGEVLATDLLWQTEIELLQDEFASAIEEHRQLAPPELFIAGHLETQRALEDCLTGWTLLYEGAVDNDQQLYQSGIPFVTSCNEHWQAGDQMIAKAKTSIGPAIDSIQVDPASLARLEQALHAELDGQIVEVSTRDVALLYIRWNIADRLADNATVQGARTELADILTAVHESSIPYSGVDAIGYFPLIDQYGNITESPVISVYYTKATLDRINWDNIMFIVDNLFDIADAATIHPEFQD